MSELEEQGRIDKALARAAAPTVRSTGKVVSVVDGTHVKIDVGDKTITAVVPASIAGVVIDASVLVRLGNVSVVESVSSGRLIRALNTTSWSIPTSLATITGWTLDVGEVAGFDPATGVFTAPSACRVRASATVSRNNAGSAIRLLVQLLHNATERDRADLTGLSGRISLKVDDVVTMAAGDTLQVRALAGASGTTLSTEVAVTKFLIELQ